MEIIDIDVKYILLLVICEIFYVVNIWRSCSLTLLFVRYLYLTLWAATSFRRRKQVNRLLIWQLVYGQ